MQEKPGHQGHRHRLREKFLKAGAEGLHDYELVELLLTYAVPRRDVKPLAKELLKRFGSLAGLMDAGPAELQKLTGLGPAGAVLVKLAKELSCQYLAQGMRDTDLLSSPQAVVDFAKARLSGQGCECFMAVFLNAKNRLIDCQVVHEGTVDHAVVYPRRILEAALAAHAAGLILVHNHPSGDPSPSDEDRALTRSIAEAAKAVDIRVLDHIVIGRGGYVSFAEKKLL